MKSIDPRGRSVRLELSVTPECAGCAAARLCSPGGKTRKELDVPVGRPSDYKVGERVTLRGTEQLHRRAITIATVVPSLALIAVMVIIYILTADQLAAALGGLGAMVFFFVGLWLLKDKIAHEFTFTVLKHPSKT